MSRPSGLIKDESLYWVVMLYDSANALVDADSTPTVAVRKNGAATADVVTITKRAATTGIYDCVYNPAGEAEGDQFTIEESATIATVVYKNSWELFITDSMRGTDAATMPGAVWDGLIASHTVSGSFGERVLVSTNTNHECLVTGSNHIATDVHEFQTSSIDADAIAASAVAEIQTGLATATELATVPKIGTQYTHTAQSGDTIQVTIS